MHNRTYTQKAIVVVVALTLIQTFGVMVIAAVSVVSSSVNVSRPVLILLVTLSLVSLFDCLITLAALRPLNLIRTKLYQSERSIDNLSNLNLTLREQRHDYLNHLQVVYSLIEMDEYQEAKEYMERVYTDIQKVGSYLKTSIPAVNAILQAKAQMCKSRGIECEISVTSSLKDIAIPAWEFCRILGNLIDNSINALAQVGDSLEKYLTIEFYEDISHHGFRISNNGPEIPEEDMSCIFEPGFTTHPESGDGMGLSITKRLIENHKGKITVSSGSDSTCFEGIIPRSKQV